jgi:TRAP transporter TAXI family solute receptor
MMKRLSNFPTLALAALALIVFALPRNAVAQGADAKAADAKAIAAPAVATVGVLSAGRSASDVQFVSDLAAVLNDGERLRILPIIGQGGVQNIDDLMALPLADVAIVQSDVLAGVRADASRPQAVRELPYVAKLFNQEVHILARRPVAALADLAGKRVAIGPSGSGESVTGGAIFSALSIPVEATADQPEAAITKLRAGEIDAMVTVASKPIAVLAGVGRGAEPDPDLHLLSIPGNEQLLAAYVPASLSAQDYPGLIAAGEEVETIAVPMVMLAAGNKPRRNPDYAVFVDAFFGKFARFQEPMRHPKWRETNLAATVPGMTRLPASLDWVRANMATPEERRLQEAFADMLQFMAAENVRPDPKLGEREKTALFWRFVDWRAARPSP